MIDKELKAAIDAINAAEKTDIKGKQYATVATRLEIFRLNFGLKYGIITEAVDTVDINVVRVRAMITNENGVVIASGLAQEDRTQSKINFTSSLEVAETSAIGRALACLGLLGGEYASYNEVSDAIANQDQPRQQPREREFRQDKAPDKVSADRPSVNQYDFYQPRSSHPDDVKGVYEQIDAIEDAGELMAYFNSLQDLLPHMQPEDDKEVRESFRTRNKQLKG